MLQPDLVEAINERLEDAARRYGITVEEIVAEVKSGKSDWHWKLNEPRPEAPMWKLASRRREK